MGKVRRKIIVTRQLSDVGDFVRRFPSDQFSVTECSTFASSSIVNAFELRRIFDDLEDFDAIVFPSQTGAMNTIAFMEEMGLGKGLLRKTKVYAIGGVTTQYLLGQGLDVLAVARGNDEAVLKSLRASIPCADKIFVPTIDNSAERWTSRLASSGCQVVSPLVPRTLPEKKSTLRACELLMAGKADCVAFTSPSSALTLQKIFGVEEFSRLAKGVTIASMNPVVTEALAAARLAVDIQPAKHTLGDLAQSIIDFFR